MDFGAKRESGSAVCLAQMRSRSLNFGAKGTRCMRFYYETIFAALG